MLKVYGFPAPMPFGIDYVTYSNEDIGYTTAYSAGVDVFQLPLPYPSSMNLWEETMIVFCIEFIYHTNPFPSAALTQLGGIIIHLSMLPDDFGANWAGNLVDAEDEAFKAQFAGPIYCGRNSSTIVSTIAVEGVDRQLDKNITAQYYPPEPLDLVTPLYMNFTNAFGNATLDTNAIVQDDDADQTEQYAVRVWFIKRDYTSAEKSWLNRLPTRFQQLDS